uniref:Putative mucin n=1 Tax=Ixodes ricinus TaxID=34613 RepID=A0A0K8RH34_IXORI
MTGVRPEQQLKGGDRWSLRRTLTTARRSAASRDGFSFRHGFNGPDDLLRRLGNDDLLGERLVLWRCFRRGCLGGRLELEAVGVVRMVADLRQVVEVGAQRAGHQHRGTVVTHVVGGAVVRVVEQRRVVVFALHGRAVHQLCADRTDHHHCSHEGDRHLHRQLHFVSFLG